jgi:hemerythrin-like metal-binding protein
MQYTIEWQSEYSTGYSTVDLQHRELIKIINQLFLDMAMGKGAYTIETIMARLEDFVKEHFSTEEELMERLAYPKLESHRTAHREFMDEFSRFQELLSSGNRLFALDLYRFLQKYVDEHFMQEDQELGAFLAKKGGAV